MLSCSSCGIRTVGLGSMCYCTRRVTILDVTELGYQEMARLLLSSKEKTLSVTRSFTEAPLTTALFGSNIERQTIGIP